MGKIVINLLKIYQKTLRPMLGLNCRHYPTCSDYMIEAIERHGIANGLKYGVKRIIKCNQFFPGGYDPVPGAVSRGTICNS